MSPPQVHDRSTQSVRRVFLAEDDAEMRQLVAGALRKDGYVVTEASDGDELLDELGAAVATHQHGLDAVDLILADVRMPAHTGLDVVRSLRNADWTAPVILITAYRTPQVRAAAEKLDAVLLDKPFQLNALMDIVHRLLP